MDWTEDHRGAEREAVTGAVAASSTAAVALAPRPFVPRMRLAVVSVSNWLQFLRFCLVGSSGYAVNLVAFAYFAHGLGLHYLVAAVCSFCVAVGNNYTWNRLWTFAESRGHVGFQGLRYFAVSVAALAANLAFLNLFVTFGADPVLAQAIAIAIATPLSFVGNKLWSFRL